MNEVDAATRDAQRQCGTAKRGHVMLPTSRRCVFCGISEKELEEMQTDDAIASYNSLVWGNHP